MYFVNLRRGLILEQLSGLLHLNDYLSPDQIL